MLTAELSQRLLQQYPMLEALPPARFDEVFGALKLMHIATGTVLFDENQACSGFPLVLSGCVRVIKASANGRELQLYRVNSGESCILTSSCLLGHTSYRARGVAATETEMLALSPAGFHILMDELPAFRAYIFALFSDRMTDLMELVSAVAFQKLDQRLAALLLAKPSPLRSTHQAIADELGSSREIVSRLLKNFEEQGWVRLGRELIEVTRAEALKKFAVL